MSDALVHGPERFLSFSAVDAPIEEVEAAVTAELSRTSPGVFSRSTVTLRLPHLYDTAPLPGGSHPKRVVAYSPQLATDKSIIMTNLADGWNSLSFNVSRAVRKFQIHIGSTEHGAEYPQNLFEVWREGESARVVMSMKDSDKWVFFQRGETEPFENPELYEQKRKSDRLNRDILVKYLQKISIDITRPEFWAMSGKGFCFDETRGARGLH